MVFTKSSRYWTVQEYLATDSKGKQNQVKKFRKNPLTKDDKMRQIKQGDRLDYISYKYYGNSTKFWIICDGNNAMHPDALLINGKKIKIPKQPF